MSRQLAAGLGWAVCLLLLALALWSSRRRQPTVTTKLDPVEQSDTGALMAFGAAWDGEGAAEHSADPLPDLRREGAL